MGAKFRPGCSFSHKIKNLTTCKLCLSSRYIHVHVHVFSHEIKNKISGPSEDFMNITPPQITSYTVLTRTCTCVHIHVNRVTSSL